MPDCGDGCMMESRISALEKDIEHNTTAHREFYGKFEEIGKAEAVISVQYGNLLSLMTEVKADVGALKDKPARRWDTVVTALITGAVGVLIGLLAAGIV